MVHAARVRGIALAFLLVTGSHGALAATNHLPDTRDVVAAAEDPAPDDSAAALQPGDYRWTPEAAPAGGPVTVLVSIPLQRAWVFRGDTQIGVTTVSTGKTGHDTPIGSFTILQKAVMHRSNLYNSAPMPYMQRLTWDGVALHAGHISGEPASHGCVRLPRAFAAALFKATGLGATVVITNQAPGSSADALALLGGAMPPSQPDTAEMAAGDGSEPTSGGSSVGQPMTIATSAP